jgi:hypothetical protein
MSSQHSSNSSGPKYETQEFNFKKLLWGVPIGIVLVAVYVGVCWFGAKKSLNAEMSKKQFQSMEADSTHTDSTGGGTPQ